MVMKVPLFSRESLLDQHKIYCGGLIDALKMIEFENEYSKLIRKVTRSLGSFHVRSGWDIFVKGDTGTELFMIRNGIVNIIDGNGKILNTLTEKQNFGEVALINKSTRTATARAATDCELCFLTRDVFEDLFKSIQILQNLVIKRIEDMTEKIKKEEEDSKNSQPWNLTRRINTFIRKNKSLDSAGSRPSSFLTTKSSFARINFRRKKQPKLVDLVEKITAKNVVPSSEIKETARGKFKKVVTKVIAIKKLEQMIDYNEMLNKEYNVERERRNSDDIYIGARKKKSVHFHQMRRFSDLELGALMSNPEIQKKKQLSNSETTSSELKIYQKQLETSRPTLLMIRILKILN
ncbi:hypothetical protein HK096_011622 [Nowakowskiella sp. JEL0078]|nr:hypothetical protein HK096_011622 [Nowakowskiella sp. JEL0078]